MHTEHWITKVSENGYATVGVAWKKESKNGKQFLSVKIAHPHDLPVDERGEAALNIFQNESASGSDPTHFVSCKIPPGYVPGSRGAEKEPPQRGAPAGIDEGW